MVMKIGLLWYDDDPKRGVMDKIEQAAQRYYEKFGKKPDTCYVNPVLLPSGGMAHNGVKVLAATTVLPDHFWVGISESQK